MEHREAPRSRGGPLLFLGLAAALGCRAVGPDYEKPVIPTPDAWHETVSQELAQGPRANLQTWWTVFDDPMLSSLIERARKSNLDLEVAVSRVREARYRLASARGEKLPVVGAGAQAGRTELSDDGLLEQVAPPGGFQPQSLFALGVDAAWEVDVFGRVRRTVEAAGAEYGAAVESYRDVLVTLLAEVALNYVQVRGYQQRIAFARANAEAQREVLALTNDRYENGLSSRLDVAQAEYNLAGTESSIPSLRIGLRLALNRLAVLLGQEAGSLQDELAKSAAIPAPGEAIPEGVPADLLRQRPDIRRAERQLAARTAEIGVATADLYPRFSLTGFLGLSTRSLSNATGGSALTWGVAAPVHWDVFAGGRIQANIHVQEELTQQALLRYENTVLLAIEEVDNAAQAFNQNSERRGWLEKAVDGAREAVELVTVQYETGVTDFNNVLDTQRDLFLQQDNLVASDADVVTSLIGLYKALGGGWDVEAETPSE